MGAAEAYDLPPRVYPYGAGVGRMYGVNGGRYDSQGGRYDANAHGARDMGRYEASGAGAGAGARYESNADVHERLAGWTMNELGNPLDQPGLGPSRVLRSPPSWGASNTPGSSGSAGSMYSAVSPPTPVREAMHRASPNSQWYSLPYPPYRYMRRVPEGAGVGIDPSSLFAPEPSASGSASGSVNGGVGGNSSGSDSGSGSSHLGSSSSFEPNWDLSAVYTRRTPLATPPTLASASTHARLTAPPPPRRQSPSRRGPPPAPSASAAAGLPRHRSPAVAAFERRIYGAHAHAQAYQPPSQTHTFTPLERGYYAYTRGADPYTLVAVPAELARYAGFGRRRLPTRLDGLSDEAKKQAARDALDAVGRLAPEERRRLAEKVLQKVGYGELCESKASAASAANAVSAASDPNSAAPSNTASAQPATSATTAAPADPATVTSPPPSPSPAPATLPPQPDLLSSKLKATIIWDAEVETSCAICQDDYVADDLATLTPCGHMYHTSCLATWLTRLNPAASTCPMCRRDLAALAVLTRMSDEGEAKRLWGGLGEGGGWI